MVVIVMMIVIVIAHGRQNNRMIHRCRGRHSPQTGMGAAILLRYHRPK
jgi:hypothetical protein